MSPLRLLLLVALGTVVAPDRPVAQEELAPQPAAVPYSRLSITPFAGMRVPLFTDRRETVIVPGRLLPLAVELETRRTGGGIGGVEAELRMFGPVGIAAAFAFTNPDEVVMKAESPDGNLVQVPFRGPSVVFARVGLSYRLPEPAPDTRDHRPAAYLVLGPARVRQTYGDAALALPDATGEDVESWALHMGIKAIFPFGSPHVLFHLGLENYATFWNPNDAEGQRLERALGLQPGTLLDASLGVNRTNVLMLNFGVSLRV